MQRQALTAAAILCLIGGLSGSNAVGKDQIPWSDLLTIADQTMQIPSFGSALRKLTPVTAENLAKELPDDRFVADLFPPARLIFADGTQETEPTGTHTVVRVIKVLPQAYALPLDSDTVNSTRPVVEGSVGFDYRHRLLFNQRRVKEWE